jgi:hypothetical protein
MDGNRPKRRLIGVVRIPALSGSNKSKFIRALVGAMLWRRANQVKRLAPNAKKTTLEKSTSSQEYPLIREKVP